MDKGIQCLFIYKHSFSLLILYCSVNYSSAFVFPFSTLGFTLDNAWTWKTHIDILMPKLSTAYCSLKMLKQTVTGYTDNDLLCLLSFTYEYGITFWGNTSYSSKVLNCRKEL